MSAGRLACDSHQENSLDFTCNCGIEKLLQIADSLMQRMSNKYSDLDKYTLHDIKITAVYRVSKKFDPDHKDANITGYLWRTLDRCALNERAKLHTEIRGGDIHLINQFELEARAQANNLKLSFEEILPPSSTGDEIVTNAIIELALNSISKFDRMLVEMYFFQDFLMKEIHCSLPNTTSIKTTERMIARAIKNLHSAVTKRFYEYRKYALI